MTFGIRAHVQADDRPVVRSLKHDGFVIVPAAVSREFLDDVIEAVYDFLGQRSDDPESWYRGAPRRHGMAQLFHHRALWDVRQLPQLHQVFTDLLGTSKLWVSIDRVNMKPPSTDSVPGWGDDGFLHWDVDPRERPYPPKLQGVVALTDTTADQGGFQCSSELFRHLDDWLTDKPAEHDRLSIHGTGVRLGPADLSSFAPEPLAMNAGDLLIWNSRLPHGNGVNHSPTPRLAQYITMLPEGTEEQRQARVTSFQDRRPPSEFHLDAPGEVGPSPQLTALGRQLLGLDRW